MHTVKLGLLTALLLACTTTAQAAESRSFSARHSDRVSACDNAKRQAEETARRGGRTLGSTTACDCSKRELDPQTAEGIAAKSVFGSTTQWTCQTDARFN